MKDIIHDVKRSLPKRIDGFEHIKTYNAGIPYALVTLECLTRRITDLNLFFESILRLTELNVNKPEDISFILGVPDNILNEAIADMVSADLIGLPGGRLSLTRKGKETLANGKRILTEKRYLSDIAVDLITGRICDASLLKRGKADKRNDVILDHVIKADNDFFNAHFRDISRIFREQQKNNSVFGKDSVISELYKIVNTKVRTVEYLQNKIDLYKSSTIKDQLFEFESDHNEEYKKALYSQLKLQGSSVRLQILTEWNRLPRALKNNGMRDDADPMMLSERDELIGKLTGSADVESDEITEAFRKHRYSVYDKEYLSFFRYYHKLKCRYVIICSTIPHTFFTNNTCELIYDMASKFTVYIVYKNVKNVERFFKKKNDNIILVPAEFVERDCICIDSTVLFYPEHHIIGAFDSNIVYTRNECFFDEKDIEEASQRLFELYELPKPDKGRKEKKRRKKQSKPDTPGKADT